MSVGLGHTTGTAAEHTAKHDSRFLALLSMLNCNDKTIARLGELHVTSVSALTTLVDDRKGLRAFLASGLGLREADGFEHTIEAGKVVMAWEQACKRSEVENKRDAERVAQDLPPQLTGEDLILLKQQYEKNFNKKRKLTQSQVPSKSYLELKVGHAETRWQAEKLTEVTSDAAAERFRKGNAHEKTFAMDEQACGFKLINKPFGIAMPEGSEALRARLKLLGMGFMFLKLKFPQKGVLSTCTMKIFDEYIDYLFGDDVWNFTQKGDQGQPISCPHQGIVQGYDQAMREKVADLMADGKDIETAFDLAIDDISLKQISFLSNFTVEVASKRCTGLSAPAFKEIHGIAGAPPKAIRDADRSPHVPTLSKKQRKTLNKAKREAATGGATQVVKKAKREKGTGKGGGQGGAQGGATPLAILDKTQGGKGKTKTADNKKICYAFNNGQDCKFKPCTFEHICQVCGSKEHGKHGCPDNK